MDYILSQAYGEAQLRQSLSIYYGGRHGLRLNHLLESIPDITRTSQALRSKGNRHSEAVLQKSERGVRGSCHRSAHPYHLIPVIPITSSRRNAEFVEGSGTMMMTEALSLLQLEEDRGKPYHLIPVIPIIPVMNPFHLIRWVMIGG